MPFTLLYALAFLEDTAVKALACTRRYCCVDELLINIAHMRALSPAVELHFLWRRQGQPFLGVGGHRSDGEGGGRGQEGGAHAGRIRYWH